MSLAKDCHNVRFDSLEEVEEYVENNFSKIAQSTDSNHINGHIYVLHRKEGENYYHLPDGKWYVKSSNGHVSRVGNPAAEITAIRPVRKVVISYSAQGPCEILWDEAVGDED